MGRRRTRGLWRLATRNDPAERRLALLDVGLAALLVLVVSVPTMVIEEDWHGHPMIEQHTSLWVVAGGVVALAFLAGGIVAGRRRPAASLPHALAAPMAATIVLLCGAVYRRLWRVHEGIPWPVGRLWLLGTLAVLFFGLLGGLVGRWLGVERGSSPGSSRHTGNGNDRGIGTI